MGCWRAGLGRSGRCSVPHLSLGVSAISGKGLSFPWLAIAEPLLRDTVPGPLSELSTVALQLAGPSGLEDAAPGFPRL